MSLSNDTIDSRSVRESNLLDSAPSPAVVASEDAVETPQKIGKAIRNRLSQRVITPNLSSSSKHTLGGATQPTSDRLVGKSLSHGYISVSSSNISPPNGFARSETLVLFDWDDTLLPSSWLAAKKLSLDSCSEPSQQDKIYLEAISDSACSLLVSAVHLGRVIVVTNAEAGWVELSGAKFIPKVLETLTAWHVSIVSARSEFKAAKRQLPVQWKIKAFEHLLNLAYPRENPCNRNVISFGDSNSERIALIQSVSKLEVEKGNCSLYKSFKLCEHPTPALLQRQLILIERILPRMIHHTGNLDLRINFKETHNLTLPNRAKLPIRASILPKRSQLSACQPSCY